MSVLVVGISHKTAPVALLERVALDADGVDQAASATSPTSEHVTEATVLATCNRVEIYADVDRFHGSVEDGLAAARASAPARPPRTLLPHLYVHYDDGAVSHLFHVAAGLDSMVVGEGQILGQTREALRIGQEPGTVGPALNVLFQQALRVGKRVARRDRHRPRRAVAGHRRARPRRRRTSATSPARACSSSAPARWPRSPSRPPSRARRRRRRRRQPHARARRRAWPREYGARAVAARRRSPPSSPTPTCWSPAPAPPASLVDRRPVAAARRRPAAAGDRRPGAARTTSTRPSPTCPASP